MVAFRTERIVDDKALVRNARRLRELADGKALIAVIKANAYGNGAVRTAKALADEAQMFAVATAREAQALRKAKISASVLILGTITQFERQLAVGLDDVAFGISSLSEAAWLDSEAHKRGRRIKVHIAVDTGMRRFGFPPDPRLIRLSASFSGLDTEGLYTHYGRVGSGEGFTERQEEIFLAVENELRGAGMRFRYVHASGSASVLRREGLCGNAFRAGLALYGVCPDGCPRSGLSAVAAVYARVLAVKTLERGEGIGYGSSFSAENRMRVAVVSAGYADGIPYSASGRGFVLVGGTKCRIVGSVCMAVFFCDVTDAGSVGEGDIVTVIGGDADGAISMEEAARLSGTSAYELSVRLAAKRR